MGQTEVLINGIAGANALLLFALLCFRKNNSRPNFALSGMMFVVGCYFINSLVMFSGHGNNFSWLFFVVQFNAIFYIPFISIHTFSILGKPIKKLWPIISISGLIGIIPVYLAISFYQSPFAAQELFFKKLVSGPYPEEVTFYSVVFYSFQQLVFIGLFILVYRLKRKAYKFYSDLDQSKLSYLEMLLLIMVVLNFSIVALYVSFDVLFVEYILLPLIVTFIYIYIIYHAFKNHAVFSQHDFKIHFDRAKYFNDLEEAEDEKEAIKNNAILEEIEAAFLERNIITDPDLTLQKLASCIGESSTNVSQAINRDLNTNFYELVNSRRVEIAKKLLKEKKNYTVEGIGYESGFNSRASFYRAFKKHTGDTPKNYLEKEQIES